MKERKGRAQVARRAFTAMVVLCALLGLVVVGCSPHQAADSSSLAATGEEQADNTQGINFEVEGGSGFLPDTDYARTYIGAANRGCNSCHDDFYELIKNYPGRLQHVQFSDAGYGKTFTINDCMPCHIEGTYMCGVYFGETLHQAHRNNEQFKAMGGDCWSCHALKDGGPNGSAKMVLWDQYKYDPELGGFPNAQDEWGMKWSKMRGHEGETVAGVTVLSDIQLDNVQLDQRLSNDEDIFEAVNGVFPDLTAENYVLEVTGGVNNPRTFTLDELKALGSTVQSAVDACVGNPINGVQVANREWEGVLISKIIDACGGLAEGTNGVMTYAADNFEVARAKGIQYLLNADAMLAWNCNGEELAPEEGYPVRLVYPGQGGALWTKHVDHLDFYEGDVDTFSFETFFDVWSSEEAAGKGTTIYNYVNGAFNGAWFTPGDDNQVYKLGEPIQLEGYAWNFVSRDRQHYTDKIAFTADYGNTWTEIDVPDDFDPDQWAYFTATWTPPKAGTYVLGVRPVDTMDWETDYWANVIVKVEE